MDRIARDQDTDEEFQNENNQMDLDDNVRFEVIDQGFWNDFGDLLDEDDLT